MCNKIVTTWLLYAITHLLHSPSGSKCVMPYRSHVVTITYRTKIKIIPYYIIANLVVVCLIKPN